MILFYNKNKGGGSTYFGQKFDFWFSRILVKNPRLVPPKYVLLHAYIALGLGETSEYPYIFWEIVWCQNVLVHSDSI